jgi:hypothetical protein
VLDKVPAIKVIRLLDKRQTAANPIMVNKQEESLPYLKRKLKTRVRTEIPVRIMKGNK